MKVAVVGCGIAGMTAAWLLRLAGHDVTIFEQAAKCGPTGAGILLQPSGQDVLKKIGLLDEVLADSARINSLHAQHRSGGTLVHLPYQAVSNRLFGLGVRRSHLFQLLFDRCLNAGVEICEGHQIVGYSQTHREVHLSDKDGEQQRGFDLLIVADGSRSRLREYSGLTKFVREYPDAALWTIGPYSGQEDCLLQTVGRCGRLVGMLPVGNGFCSFFWGLKKTEVSHVRSQGIDDWKHKVIEFIPAAEEIVADISSLDQVPYATYRTSKMKSVIDGRVAFIGDAAHATSPHLGQGLNLALEDAQCLVDQLASCDDHVQAYNAYQTARRSTIRYYSVLTGTLTPFFQTSNRLLQLGRDMTLPLMPHLPYVGRQMVYTMAGLKTGWLTAKHRHDSESSKFMADVRGQ